MVFLAGPLFRWRRGDAAEPDAGDLDAFFETWKDFAACFFVNETMFYWGHRMLHSRFLYAKIHRHHHMYVATKSVAAEYAHPLEDVLTAYLPYLAGSILACGGAGLVSRVPPRLGTWGSRARRRPRFESASRPRRRRDVVPTRSQVRARFHFIFVWFFCRLTETYESHSGYCLRGSLYDWLGLSHWPQSVFHDHHHAVNAGCFGWIPLDYLFGTMDHWSAAGGAEGYLGAASGEGYLGAGGE